MAAKENSFLLDDIPGPEHTFELGPLTLFVRRTAEEWKVAFRREPEALDRWRRVNRIDAGSSGTDALKWMTLSARGDEERLRLRPAPPALPVVIRPKEPYVLRPGDKISFFMTVPLTMRLVVTSDPEQILWQEPTRIMSKTWFGDQESGELALASRTFAVRKLSLIDQHRYRFICPVRMRNVSDGVLPFDRFCLRTEMLDLFAGKQRYWSNEVGISYKGVEEASRVAINPSAPGHESGLVQVMRAPKRERGFSQIKTFFMGDES